MHFKRCFVVFHLGLWSALVGEVFAAPELLLETTHTSSYSSNTTTATASFHEYKLNNLSIDAIVDHAQMFAVSRASRSVGTTSYNDTVHYVEMMLENAGYKNVTRQVFTALVFKSLGNSTLSTGNIEYIQKTDFNVMAYSGYGPALSAVGEAIPNLGCEAVDYANFMSGNIAIISRGTCYFGEKAAFAQDAGAVGVIIYQPLDHPEGESIIVGNLGDDIEPYSLPTFFTTFNVSQELAGKTVTMFANVSKTMVPSSNILAETEGGNDSQIVMAGAHLDSVPAGPGINDNGSGSATLLEIAIQMAASVKTVTNKVRFAWWGAEEIGLKGSEFYVNQLTPMESSNIALYLNFDMIGSSNWGRFVLDDSSVTGEKNITAVFQQYFEYKNLVTEIKDSSGGCRSDYCFFQKIDIPTGGLFTGAEGNKTENQTVKFGGVAGVLYDPCYHLACDTLANLNFEILEEMANATAHAILTFADMDTIDFEVVQSENHVEKILNSEYRGDFLIK